MPARRPLVLLGAAAGAAVAAAIGWTLAAGDEPARDLLPNLVAAAPGALDGRTAPGPRFYLGFASAAANLGAGPLVVVGRRASRAEPEMQLRQRIDRTDGSVRVVPVDATLRYVRSPDHSHWHLLGFMRYELRSTSGGTRLRDRKTGFCLGDRYRADSDLPGPDRAAFPDRCGKGAPRRLTIREGISVGWGDNYHPHLEGQKLDVTDVPAGRYVLVHRVNPQRLLRESDYADNVSSLALDLSWPRGRSAPPRVGVVARCQGTATCP